MPGSLAIRLNVRFRLVGFLTLNVLHGVGVKDFGCRPIVTYRRAQRAGVRKPPRKEPAGGRVGRLALYGDLTEGRLCDDAVASAAAP